MLSFDDLRLFQALAEVGSLTQAARTLGVSPPALSMRLKRIEQDMRLQLVVRNPRAMTLTEEGANLAREASSLLAQFDQLTQRVTGAGEALRGPLRVVSSFGFGRKYVAPMMHRFAIEHPEISITLILAENPLRTATGTDIVIHVGAISDSSWVAHPLMRNERWLCASPDYIKRRGMPTHPKELSQHACLCLRENEEDITLWHFQPHLKKAASSHSIQSAELEGKLRTKRNEQIWVRVIAHRTTNDGDVLTHWAEAGAGIIVRSQWDVGARVLQGKLVRMLPEWSCGKADVVALVPSRLGQSARVTEFLKFAKRALAIG